MAAAVLLRRYFDRKSEQAVNRKTPYRKETIEVIAGMLRVPQTVMVRKVLADGLRYAVDLRGADLSNCTFDGSYLGQKDGDLRSADMTYADLFGSRCEGTSFRAVTAVNTVFYSAHLRKAVFEEAVCREADFRAADCSGAKFGGADLAGAKFAGAQIGGARFRTKPKFKGDKGLLAKNIPAEVKDCLDEDGVAAPGSVVREVSDAR